MPEHPYVDESGFAGHTLTSPAGVTARVLANGALETLTVGPIMVNLLVGSPVGGGATKLYGRTHDPACGIGEWKELLLGAQVGIENDALTWRGSFAGAAYAVTLALHPQRTAWQWAVAWAGPGPFDAVLVQDVGIASRGQSQNNEAYTSQYIDHRVLDHPAHGPVVAARQNLGQPGGHPWVMHACLGGAAGVATDGLRFFGPAHRATGVPALVTSARWPREVLQHEWSTHALASAPRRGAQAIRFAGCFVADHPAATSDGDLARLDELDELDEPGLRPAAADPGAAALAPLEPLAALAPTDADLRAWCPEPHRHVERLGGRVGGQVASFFHGPGRHAVTYAKEVAVTRRHGHLLRSGGSPVPSAHPADAPLCSTVWAHGVFASHVCLGNTSFNKMLSVARDPHGIVNDRGLRIAAQLGDGPWRLLAVPSLFDTAIDDARWVYKHDRGCFEVVARVSGGRVSLAVLVTDGPAVALRIAAHLVGGDREHERPGVFTLDPAAGRLTLPPARGTLFAGAYPEASFDLTFDTPEQLAAFEQPGALPWAIAQTRPTRQLRFSIGGTLTHDARAADPVSHVPAPLRLETDGPAAALADALPWFEHCAGIHLSAPHGLEQYGGAAWGVRDVCQGPLEWLLGRGDFAAARTILCDVFANQRDGSGVWPQWYMHPPFAQIASDHAHGDVAFWPILAAAQYLEASNDFTLLHEKLPYFDAQAHAPTHDAESVLGHLDHALAAVAGACLPGTALPAYGHGDWNDSLQPADPALKDRMASGWTAGLYHMALRRLAGALAHGGERERAERLHAQADRVRDDFRRHVIKDGVAAGFYLQGDGPDHLLHPGDTTTGVRYRLLPMIRGVLSELFTPAEAADHLALIKRHLLAPDGARLMDRPPAYRGGPMTHFQRSESASFFGREVGIMYVHAHLRYAQALAVLGDAPGLYQALLTVCPVALADTVKNANPRQANLYFSSSDAAVADRYDAAERYDALMRGGVPVDGGWRLYSSGPGIYVGLVVQHLLGLRPRFDQLVVDPQLPAALLGGGRGSQLAATLTLEGRPARVRFQPADAATLTVNGTALAATGTEANPYRRGGATYARAAVAAALRDDANDVTVGVAGPATARVDRLTL